MNFKKLFKRLRFNFTTAEYMRVAYLSPRKVVMVTTRLDGKDNVLPIDWHMPVSFEPKLYAICLTHNNHSAQTIRITGEFVVNFVGAELEEKILLCGRSSGKDIDKFDLSGLSRKAASEVQAVVLMEASGYIECRVTEVREWGDHTVFVGKVVHEAVLKEETPALYHVTKF